MKIKTCLPIMSVVNRILYDCRIQLRGLPSYKTRFYPPYYMGEKCLLPCQKYDSCYPFV